MKAIISTTYSNTYLYFLPITTWCWNRLGVDVICFMPRHNELGDKKLWLAHNTIAHNCAGRKNIIHYFDCPEHKEATYAQCSRLYAACLDLPEDEILITSDCDMALFKIPEYVKGTFSVFGADLVPDGQVPICYLTATVKQWRDTFNLYHKVWEGEQGQMIIGVKTYQQSLDELLGNIECENMRGNYWSKDQQEAHDKILNNRVSHTAIQRTNGQNQFAQNRVDRDDTNWRSYVNDELIDAHLWRPGFTDENFANIMELLTMKYPNDDFTWLVTYNEQYKQLL